MELLIVMISNSIFMISNSIYLFIYLLTSFLFCFFKCFCYKTAKMCFLVDSDGIGLWGFPSELNKGLEP